MRFRPFVHLCGLTTSLVACVYAVESPADKGVETVRRLNAIVIPELKFQGESLLEAAKSLTELSALYSKDGTRITFVVTNEPLKAMVKVPVDYDEELRTTIEDMRKSAWPDMPIADQIVGTNRSVTLHLRQVPLIEAIEYVTALAGANYRIENDRVLLGHTAMRLEARAYKYQKKEFDRVDDIKVYSSVSGYKYSSSFRTIPERKLLVILNTAENLERFEKLTGGADLEPYKP